MVCQRCGLTFEVGGLFRKYMTSNAIAEYRRYIIGDTSNEDNLWKKKVGCTQPHRQYQRRSDNEMVPLVLLSINTTWYDIFRAMSTYVEKLTVEKLSKTLLTLSYVARGIILCTYITKFFIFQMPNLLGISNVFGVKYHKQCKKPNTKTFDSRKFPTNFTTSRSIDLRENWLFEC